MKTLFGTLSLIFTILALCGFAVPSAIGAWSTFIICGWIAMFLMKYSY